MKKMQKQKSRKAIAALSILLVVGIIAGTLAAFNASFQFDNLFTMSSDKIGAQFVETFDDPGTVTDTGANVDKFGFVTNTGKEPVVARTKVSAQWVKPAYQTGTGFVLDADGTTVLKDTANQDTKDFSKTALFINRNKGTTEKAAWAAYVAKYGVANDALATGYTSAIPAAATLKFGNTVNWNSNNYSFSNDNQLEVSGRLVFAKDSDATEKYYYDKTKKTYYDAATGTTEKAPGTTTIVPIYANTATGNWILSENDGYFYYNKVIAGADKTENILDEVAINAGLLSAEKADGKNVTSKYYAYDKADHEGVTDGDYSGITSYDGASMQEAVQKLKTAKGEDYAGYVVEATKEIVSEYSGTYLVVTFDSDIVAATDDSMTANAEFAAGAAADKAKVRAAWETQTDAEGKLLWTKNS